MKNSLVIIVVIVLILVIAGFFLFNNPNQSETYDDSDEGITNSQKNIEEEIVKDVEEKCFKPIFNYAPVNMEKTKLIVPLGLMSGNHVTPIDHIYFQDFSNNEVDIEVYSPGDGFVTDIQHMPGALEGEDFRILIEHDCDISSIFIHIYTLTEKLYDKIGNKDYVPVNIPIEAGELLGWYSTNVDYNVVDQNIFLEGLLVSEHYDSEPWKIHTPSDQYSYFNDEIKNQLIEKSLRHEAPYSGRFDWDIDGTLQGNWFVEGSKGYEGIVGQQYWDSHLSFSPDYLDYNHFLISMGSFNGQPEQFGAKGNTPNPLEVSTGTGIVTYELVNFDFFTENGESWDRQSLEIIKEVKNKEQVSGTVLVEMIEDRKIKFEVFPEKTASQVNGFTNDAKIYIR